MFVCLSVCHKNVSRVTSPSVLLQAENQIYPRISYDIMVVRILFSCMKKKELQIKIYSQCECLSVRECLSVQIYVSMNVCQYKCLSVQVSVSTNLCQCKCMNVDLASGQLAANGNHMSKLS